ncbi:MAG: MaoC family dehydratase [Burkholderiaceae bacterium]|nr:MaoC family dehydratase [Burkholderiaceae bacterium]
MKFAEFHAGQRLTAGPYRVSEADIVAFAQQWDPQWFHADVQAASASHWGGVIASGWHTASIAMRLVADHFLVGSESFASPGLEQLRWPAPVKPGDLLTLQVEVIEARRSRQKPLGILRWRWQLLNQREQEVLDLTVTSLFDLGPDAAAPGA